MRIPGIPLTAAALLCLPALAAAVPPQFESPHVHPIELSGNRVLVVNTPDARLSIFSRAGGELSLQKEIRVGIDPVTVRAKSATEAWVVNHVSDDISIVDVVQGTVIRTLHVGDEPTDVVFIDDPIEDDGSKWAVVSVSQEDRILVCDAEAPYTLFGAVDLPGADPRGLAVDATGVGVWVGMFESGNRTTLAPRSVVADSTGPWGGNPPPYVPPLDPGLPDSILPSNGVIIRFQGTQWLDEQGGDWTSLIPWNVMDNDLVHIDVSSGVPVLDQIVTDAGTLIHDVVVNPDTGDLWALAIESFSEVLFEPKLIGEAVRNRAVRVLNGATVAEPFELNPHIAFGPSGQPNPPSAQTLRDQSLTIPTDAVFAERNNQTELYVAGIGGKRIVVLDPATGAVKRRLRVPEGGTGLAHVPGADVLPTVQQESGPIHIALKTGDLLLVDRFANRVRVVDPVTGDTGESIAIGRSAWDPTPDDVLNGRRFLYTGSRSAHGTFACASCHPSANMDAVAWDLGDPTGDVATLIHPNPPFVFNYHPLKGPMVTQSLRGLKDHNPLHWRGDKMDFTAFNGAFASLLGGDTLSTPEMLDYETFILSIEYPPNPFADLDNQVGTFPDGGEPDDGAAVFDSLCERCHVLPTGTGNQVQFLGQVFGAQNFVVPQVRNLYEKEGFTDFFGPNNKRGFGFLHDGMERNLDEFLLIFQLNPVEHFDIKAFLRSFPTGNDGALGQEATINPATAGDPVVLARAASLQNAADAGRTDLIAHGIVGGIERGFLWIGNAAGGLYQSDRTDRVWTFQELQDAVTLEGSAVTWTAVPLGEGVRMGVDRDLDGFLDGDEEDAGSDPADPGSTPTLTGIGDDYGLDPALTRVTSVFPQPFASEARIELYVATAGRARVEIFDVSGRRVRGLLDESVGSGSLRVSWDGRDDRGAAVANGTYFVTLVAPRAKDTRKVIRLR